MQVTHDSTNFICTEHYYFGFTCQDEDGFFMAAFGPEGISINDEDDSILFSYEDATGMRFQALLDNWVKVKDTIVALKSGNLDVPEEVTERSTELEAVLQKYETALVEAMVVLLQSRAKSLYLEFLSVKSVEM